ncbi:hypothetical protein M3231_10515 [Neobacillus mesonae]|nr:hypothetical protein [Neobacillus mesonae]
MVVFMYIGFFVMPFIGILFVVTLLRAIKKIVNKKPYNWEVFWSSTFFALIVWTLAMMIVST